MTKNPRTPPFLFVLFLILFLFSIVDVAYAETDYSIFDLTALPTQLAAHLMIDTFTAGLICSAILILIPLLAITIITRSKYSSWIPELALSLVLMGVCVALTWLPVFFIVAFALIIALMFAGKARDMITGGGK
ncbi:hypothetical protein ES702_02560 [subsurface metagenome]